MPVDLVQPATVMSTGAMLVAIIPLIREWVRSRRHVTSIAAKAAGEAHERLVRLLDNYESEVAKMEERLRRAEDKHAREVAQLRDELTKLQEKVARLYEALETEKAAHARTKRELDQLKGAA